MSENRPLLIRRAAAYDVVNLSKMLIKARDEQAEHIYYPGVPDGDKGRKMVVYHVLGMVNDGVVFVADFNKRLVGAIGMHATKMADWSDDYGLLNEWFFVMPQFRDSDISSMLLKAVESWADADINPWNGERKPRMPIVMGMLSGHQTGLKDKFMKKEGYTYGGGNFTRGIANESNVEDNSDEGNTRVA